ncbi:MAG: glycoside hydrolase family 30 protein [Armatimonadota bacterium]
MTTVKLVNIYTTCKDTEDRLTAQPALSFGDAPDYMTSSVIVDATKRFQTIEGFGGAFTEATASTFYKMPPAAQAEMLHAYFDPQHGHGYTLCRTHINSCDFALGNYAYTEVDGDVDLQHFTLERDRQALIPLIKAALRTAGQPIKLFASPWSPPAWMKTTGRMNQGGKLKPEYRQAWANYYCRYIAEYAQEGIPIWGLTVQNEPEATQTWDSCIYTGEEERDFVRDYLGPALQAHGLSDIKLMIWDHNRDRMFERAKAVYDDPEAAKYVWGTAFHWYCGDHFDNVQMVHDAWPEKQLLFSEGCQEWGTHIGSWDVGERYGNSMINDLNRWTVAWTDWNMVLDETGGPNHVNNLCSAPIIADTKAGTLYYHSSYYYIGHFTRFIRPGAQRIISAATRDELQTTAFQNPDGTIAVVVMNRSDEEIPFALKFDGQAVMTVSPGRSIQTYVI